jgi:V8-like Glu-specific endopeptidase
MQSQFEGASLSMRSQRGAAQARLPNYHYALGQGRSLPASALQTEASDKELEIIGTQDQRTQVKDTTKIPYRWICSLKVYFRDPDDPGRVIEFDKGSGLLIGPSHVLTAAHVIYGEVTGSRGTARAQQALRIKVYPGRSGTGTMPFGGAESESFAYPAKFTANLDRRWDYGLIKLKSSIGLQTFKSLGNRPLGYWGSDALTKIAALDPAYLRGKVVNVAGYPDGKSHTQWIAYDLVDKVPPTVSGTAIPELITYLVDTSDGQSGAPVWRFIKASGVRYLVAVHLGGCHPSLDGCMVQGKRSSNLGLLLTKQVIAQINYWKDTMENPPAVRR